MWKMILIDPGHNDHEHYILETMFTLQRLCLGYFLYLFSHTLAHTVNLHSGGILQMERGFRVYLYNC